MSLIALVVTLIVVGVLLWLSLSEAGEPHALATARSALPNDGLAMALRANPSVFWSEWMPVDAMGFGAIPDAVDRVYEPTLCDAVPHVVGVAREEQVGRVDAGRVIAVVAY